MSIEAYEQLVERFELYGLLQEGLTDADAGKTRPFLLQCQLSQTWFR
jgi:hypothetical protein